MEEHVSKFDYNKPRIGTPLLEPDELLYIFLDFLNDEGWEYVTDKFGERKKYKAVTLKGFTSYLQKKDIIGWGNRKYWYDLPVRYNEVKADIKERIEEHHVQALLGNHVSTAGSMFYLKNVFGWKDKIENVNVTVEANSGLSDNDLLEIINSDDKGFDKQDNFEEPVEEPVEESDI